MNPSVVIAILRYQNFMIDMVTTLIIIVIPIIIFTTIKSTRKVAKIAITNAVIMINSKIKLNLLIINFNFNESVGEKFIWIYYSFSFVSNVATDAP